MLMLNIRSTLFLLLTLLLLTACGTPVSPQYEKALGEQQARQILQKVKISRDPVLNKHVRRVGSRIAQVSNRPDFTWRYYVIDSPKANAFVLPGGKVFVYKGIFKYVRNDAELATVIGHEVAHALRSHGVKGAQRQQNASLVGALLQIGLGAAGVDPSVAQTATQAYSYGATLGYLRPYSRKNELEADTIGLMLMSQAGYDPRAAITFWKKFGMSGPRPPEFISTHPNPGNRIANLRRLMPKALAIYKQHTKHTNRYYARKR